MTPADAVLGDALREAGHEHLTPWRLRAVEAYLQAIADPEVHPWDWDKVGERLTRDLKERTLDGIHLRALWESINGADSWASNPWVWCVEFKQVTP